MLYNMIKKYGEYFIKDYRIGEAHEIYDKLF